MPSRTLIPYWNASTQGQGLEGFINWANITSEYWLIPTFLFVFYILAIYLATRNEYKMGGQIAFISLVFFLLGMLAQTFTEFNQLVIFVFALGGLVGIVMSFIENART